MSCCEEAMSKRSSLSLPTDAIHLVIPSCEFYRPMPPTGVKNKTGRLRETISILNVADRYDFLMK
jgi:hypothetical protein